MKRLKFGAVALAVALLCAPCLPVSAAVLFAAQQDAPPDVEQALFSRGQTLYNQGRYEQAATVLNDFLKTYPNSIIADLTLLWLGRSYIALGRLPDAEQIATRLRAIKDTPFVDIYDDELSSARRESAARGPVAAQPTPTARAIATPTPRRVATPANTTIATATPSPTPARVRQQPRPTPTPRLVTPRPTPTPLLAQADTTESRSTPTPDNTQGTTSTRPSRRGQGRRGAATRPNQPELVSEAPGRVVNITPAVRATPTPTPRVPADPDASGRHHTDAHADADCTSRANRDSLVRAACEQRACGRE